jgi:predicted transcriptional regulator of viral defense system
MYIYSWNCQAMKLRPFFENHPVFHYEEFVEYMRSLGVTQVANWRRQLSYHQKTGTLIHIRKALYAVNITPSKPDIWIDPFLIAGKAIRGAIIAYHSALELHGFAYSTFEEFTYLANKPIKPFTYQSQRFRSIISPKTLVKGGNEMHGVINFERQGLTIKLTSLERTIVDLLDRPDLGGGWEEIWRSLDHIVHFNAEKLVEYTLLLNNATTVAKVGFFLENRPKHLAVEPKFIEQLLPHIPNQPHYMNRDRRGDGKYFKKWQLIVPLEIIEQKWEEPHVDDI